MECIILNSKILSLYTKINAVWVSISILQVPLIIPSLKISQPHSCSLNLSGWFIPSWAIQTKANHQHGKLLLTLHLQTLHVACRRTRAIGPSSSLMATTKPKEAIWCQPWRHFPQHHHRNKRNTAKLRSAWLPCPGKPSSYPFLSLLQITFLLFSQTFSKVESVRCVSPSLMTKSLVCCPCLF